MRPRSTWDRALKSNLGMGPLRGMVRTCPGHRPVESTEERLSIEDADLDLIPGSVDRRNLCDWPGCGPFLQSRLGTGRHQRIGRTWDIDLTAASINSPFRILAGAEVVTVSPPGIGDGHLIWPRKSQTLQTVHGMVRPLQSQLRCGNRCLWSITVGVPVSRG